MNKYPNQWYVEYLDAYGENWHSLLGSVGNKSYAEGFFNALQSFNPRPAYRIVDKNGNVAKESGSRKGVHVN